MRKYEITDRTMKKNGVTLHQIRAVMDIDDVVSSGDFGGWIENEENLSHEGNSWIFGNAKAYYGAQISGNAKVYGDAEVYGDARVYGDAHIYGNAGLSGTANVFGSSSVYGNARVFGNARIYGDAEVYGDATVYGNAGIGGNANVYGRAIVYGDAEVCGNARVFGNAKIANFAIIEKTSDYLTIGPIGSRNDTTTFFRNKEGLIMVFCGCFSGTMDKFLWVVDVTHGQNKHAVAYRAAAELAKIQINTESISKEESRGTENE